MKFYCDFDIDKQQWRIALTNKGAVTYSYLDVLCLTADMNDIVNTFNKMLDIFNEQNTPSKD